MYGTKKRAGAYVHQQHYRKLAFFLEQFAERMIKTRRDIPVDKTDIIARGIFTHLPKAHTTALEGAVIFTCEKMPGEPFAFYLELPHLLEYFGSSKHFNLME